MEIVLASIEHLEAAAELFDQYRIFYQQPSDLEAAKAFLKERFQHQDSTVFLAWENGEAIELPSTALPSIGFIQLYPSFSSVSMKRIWIVNDLFVAASHRQRGVAKLLMGAAERHGRETGAVRLALSTQISNGSAQKLYESLGYVKDEEFYHYGLRL
jgi:ribosomal protein S18 acetylase RimI-like enzyme